MKYMNLLFALLILTSIENIAQNFFPGTVGDKFQEEYYEKHYHSLGNSWEQWTYPKFTISDSLHFENVMYYNYNNKYFSYDSIKQQLNIYIDGVVHLAVDFNQPADTSQILYYLGYPREWKSNGIFVRNILGKDRLVYKMVKDSSWLLGPTNKYMEWIVEFVDGIGFYASYYREWNMGSYYDDIDTYTHRILLAKVGTSEINTFNQKISLIDPVKDRKLNEFGYALGLKIENPIASLISKFYVEYNIYRNGNLNASKTFNIDRSTSMAFINPQSGDLAVGDSITLRCILQDTSIFNNITTCPETGFYTYKILSNLSSVEGSESERVSEYQLGQNYPNPFNPTTVINYSVPKQSNVKLIIFDALGRVIAILVNEEKQPGSYEVEFQSAVGNQQLASGIYFYQLRAGEFVQTKKMILLR